MGQKVSPHGLRVGVIKDWDSKWYADKTKFADYLIEDNKVRDFVKKKLYAAGVSKIVLERAAENKLKVIVMTAKPGMVIGRSGTGIDELKGELEKMTGKTIIIDIKEAGRSADSRKYRSGSGEKSFLQKSHEAGHRQDHEGRSQGYQGPHIGKTGRCGNRQIRKVQRR